MSEAINNTRGREVPGEPKSHAGVALVALALSAVLAAPFIAARFWGEEGIRWAVDQNSPAAASVLCLLNPKLANATDRYGDPILGYGLFDPARRGVVVALLKRGADPNAGPRSGRLRSASNYSFLGVAIAHSDADVARTLLEHGADPNKDVADRVSPLAHALTSSFVPARRAELVAALLEAGADPNAKMAYTEWTALGQHALMLRNQSYMLGDPDWIVANRKIVDALLKHGADPNALGPLGLRPLHQAIACDLPGYVDALLEGGADPNLRVAPHGSAPLGIALRDAQWDIARSLLRHGADPAATLERSSYDGEGLYRDLCRAMPTAETIRAFLAANAAPLDERDNPLCDAKNAPFVRALLLAGFAWDYPYDTAVHFAVREGEEALLDALLAAGARADLRNDDGQSPIGVAKELGRDAMLAKLRAAAKSAPGEATP